MTESSTRQVRRIKKDRISVLPLNIQETILCCMPVRDAVRTSILSTKWRHCWTKVPHLVFDENILGGKEYDSRQCHGPELNALKFVSVVNKVLLLHNGPVLKFSLSFPYFCDSMIIHDFVSQWIPLFSRKGIKQLTLEDHFHGEFTAHNFSSLELTQLRLAKFRLPYTPAFGGLTYLRIIELVNVANSEDSIFDCPVLEKLTLIFCEGLLPINFRAPNLKCLQQICFKMTSEYSLAGLENLKEFYYGLSVVPEMQTETSNVVKVFGSLHKIEKISIAMCFITYLAAGGSPNRFSKPLSFLKTLSISGVNLTRLPELSCLLCLIRSAPNLCKLHISADQDAEEENYWKIDFEDCTVDHLEIVTFSNFQGFRAELELVKLLLAHAPLLKTMFIHRDWDMEKDSIFEILEEMLKFSRASSRAQIRSLRCPFKTDDFGQWVNQFEICDDHNFVML